MCTTSRASPSCTSATTGAPLPKLSPLLPAHHILLSPYILLTTPLSSRLLRLSPDVADLSKLTVLDVSHNYIRYLPVEIKNMAALTTLNVGTCLITHHNPRHIIISRWNI